MTHIEDKQEKVIREFKGNIYITAEIVWAYYSSLIDVGFTEDQALIMVNALQNKMFNGE